MRQHSSSRGIGTWLRALLLAGMVGTFALVTLGGIVRVTESGLGCPDWPLCHGKLLPPLEFHVLVEYSHRLVASLLSAIIVLTATVAWWKYRHDRRVLIPVSLALGFLGVEVALGGVAVLAELPPTVVTAHLAVSQAIFALLLLPLVLTRTQVEGESGASESGSLRRWALGGALGVLAVVLSGSYAVGAGAGFACGSWPFCNAGFSVVGESQWTQMAHRILAALVGLLVGWVVMLGWRQRRRSPLIALTSVHVGVLLVAQMLAGALNPWSNFAVAARAVHLSLATALWGALVVLATLAWRPFLTTKANISPTQPAVGSSARPVLLLLRDYVILTKPRVMILLLITALGGMVLASKGVPSLALVLVVLGGGALASGGASALNHFLERDIDQRMQRTRRRPVASRRVRPHSAFVFGVVLNVLAFALLWVGANLMAALLALGGSAFYVLIYTQWLKRSTAQNIVIGGAAGAVPPLVGWAAVTGGLGLPALYLFAIIFFWTPPHFWALALMLKDDYARAGIPMLPVVSGPVETARSILLYTLMLVALTLLFFTVQAVGWLYFGAAAALGGVFLSMAWRVLRSGGARGARSLYLYSMLYLALLFGAAMVDSILQP